MELAIPILAMGGLYMITKQQKGIVCIVEVYTPLLEEHHLRLL